MVSAHAMAVPGILDAPAPCRPAPGIGARAPILHPDAADANRSRSRTMTARPVFLFALAAAAAGVTATVPTSAAAQEVIDERISTEYQPLRLVRLASGIPHPWAVGFLPDGRLLVTERGGRLHLIDGGTRTEVGGTPPVHARNQGGLLDVAVHPDHAGNGWIYLTWSKGDADSTTTALSRARLDGTRLVGLEEIFVTNAWGQPGGHYGSRIVFLDDGTLLMSVGDRMREPGRSQDPLDHAGTILRLNDDGTVPADNPHAGDAGYARELFSWGHRNIQALARHPSTGAVWAFEHGPRGSDLLHRVVPGGNHGWPDATRGREYASQAPFTDGVGETDPADAGFVMPVHDFVITLAPSGLTAVTGGGWHETWQGNLLGGGLRGERVLRMVVEDGRLVHAEELLLGRIGRIRDVRQGPDGFIYIVTDQEDGGVYRLEPAERDR
jgi:aldose sugar dehydrogenase